MGGIFHIFPPLATAVWIVNTVKQEKRFEGLKVKRWLAIFLFYNFNFKYNFRFNMYLRLPYIWIVLCCCLTRTEIN